MQDFNRSKSNLRYSCLLTPVGVAEKSKLTAEFLRRNIAEHEMIQVEIEALRWVL